MASKLSTLATNLLTPNTLEKNTLPEKKDFFSTLTETSIKDNEYDHAVEVWRHFGCETLGQYSDLYLKIDVLLLADIFKNVRDLCMSTYGLDPAYYFTAPGMEFHCMLKKTKIKYELLTGYSMLLLFEKGMNKKFKSFYNYLNFL